MWHTTHINSDERKKLFKKGASAEGQADVLLMGNIKLVFSFSGLYAACNFLFLLDVITLE